MKKHVRRSCFTLMEMVVVVLIVALLAGLVGPAVFKQLDKAKTKTAKSDCGAIGDAIEMYNQENKQKIQSTSDLVKLVMDTGEDTWDGPYLGKRKTVPSDPWGNEYIVHRRDDGGIEVMSYGLDGQPGGSKLAADISNWE